MADPRLKLKAIDEEPKMPPPSQPAAPEQSEVRPPDERKHILQKPVMAYGRELTELVFREPTGMDILKHGNPVVFDPLTTPPKITHDWPRMVPMLSDLAKVPMSTISQLHPQDLVACAWIVTPFFMPVPGSL